VSRVNVLKVSGSEILNEDPETVRINQGLTLNKSIFSLNSLLRDLAGSPHGDFANYDDSVLTSLSRDIFGGNSLCIGIFCISYDDSIGSAMTMRALRRCQSIMNFPI
jgi:hypothetical protein